MTEKELKALAKSMGYNVIKIRKEKFLPCTCGFNRRDHLDILVEGEWRYKLRCANCGKVVIGKSKTNAKHKWNEVIRSEMNGRNNTKS